MTTTSVNVFLQTLNRQ